MDRFLMYLRKSRMDTDFDEVSVEETLNRHRKILNSFYQERKLNVVEVLKEVISGESLSARPKMMRLLELVNTGIYAGVVCVDIERLSRGSFSTATIFSTSRKKSALENCACKDHSFQNEV